MIFFLQTPPPPFLKAESSLKIGRTRVGPVCRTLLNVMDVLKTFFERLMLTGK